MPLESGSKLGVYEIVEALGRGGMGEVYRARDTKLGREVAIKVLPDELRRDSERLQRFEREARVLASLNHPGIATLYGLETERDVPFLAMELVPGETLAERLSSEQMDHQDIVIVFQQIAEAIEAAHARGAPKELPMARVSTPSTGNASEATFRISMVTLPPRRKL